MSAKKNIRRHPRIPYINPVRISWEEECGPACFALTRCVDLSQSGMRLESPQPVKPGLRIHLRLERIQYSGSATVKHVIRRGCKYFLGVYFSQPLPNKTISEIEGRPFVCIDIENFNRIDQKI
jgi:hypothetical protein